MKPAAEMSDGQEVIVPVVKRDAESEAQCVTL